MKNIFKNFINFYKFQLANLTYFHLVLTISIKFQQANILQIVYVTKIAFFRQFVLEI